MTINELKELHPELKEKEEEYVAFSKLKENKKCLQYSGVYILTDGDEVIYIGSSYARKLRDRLMQYQRNNDSGNTLKKDLIDMGKITAEDAVGFIEKLTIHGFMDESLEYKLIKTAELEIANKNGK